MPNWLFHYFDTCAGLHFTISFTKIFIFFLICRALIVCCKMWANWLVHNVWGRVCHFLLTIFLLAADYISCCWWYSCVIMHVLFVSVSSSYLRQKWSWSWVLEQQSDGLWFSFVQIDCWMRCCPEQTEQLAAMTEPVLRPVIWKVYLVNWIEFGFCFDVNGPANAILNSMSILVLHPDPVTIVGLSL